MRLTEHKGHALRRGMSKETESVTAEQAAPPSVSPVPPSAIPVVTVIAEIQGNVQVNLIKRVVPAPAVPPASTTTPPAPADS